MTVMEAADPVAASESYDRMMKENAFTREEKLVLTHELWPERLSEGMRGLISALRFVEEPLNTDLITALPNEYGLAIDDFKLGFLRERAKETGYEFFEALPA